MDTNKGLGKNLFEEILNSEQGFGVVKLKANGVDLDVAETEIAGRTIAYVKEKYGTQLYIDKSFRAYVLGDAVSDSYEIQSGDMISFDSNGIGGGSSVTQVRVISGAMEKDFNVGGQTVNSIRKKLAQSMSIDGAAQALVDGEPASGDTIVYGGATLQFHKDAGQKG